MSRQPSDGAYRKLPYAARNRTAVPTRPSPRRALALGALVLCAALVGLVSGSALAVDPPVDLQYACALKSNGLMRAATSPSACNTKNKPHSLRGGG